ncbi:hypothetical protein E2C01_075859 [Portunus trituberculatus]|uniref:Uncharacterized protein n=2 Tax=Portunus trituberculatus TaxID=210409 RepID=A0A5B7IG20_PORTR|nr:hypothetical protein [Portunus trituberculatus]
MMAISVLFKFLSTILYIISWWLYKSPPRQATRHCQNDLTLSSPTTPPCTPRSDPKDLRGARELQGIDNLAADLT